MKFKNNKLKLKNKILTSDKIDVSNFEIKYFIEGWTVIVDKKTKKEGWINEDFTKLINPIFDDCFYFKEGFAVFKKNNKWGWIDETGEILAEGFDYCYEFREGFGIFKKKRKEGFINRKGEILIEDFDMCFSFKDGFAYFRKNGKDGYIDKNGEVVKYFRLKLFLKKILNKN